MPAPANDNWANAATLSGVSGNITGHTIGAGIETGEPGHYNYNPGPAYPVARAVVGPYRTVWYRWAAPAADYFSFSTRDLTGALATNFQTSLQAFTGSAVNALTAVTYTLNQSVGDGNGTDNGASIAFHATAGTTYYLQIDGRGPVEGDFKLTWNKAPNPPVKLCSEPRFDVSVVCLGSVDITDITKDGWYSFGTVPAVPGNLAVKPSKGMPLTGSFGSAEPYLVGADGDFGAFKRWVARHELDGVNPAFANGSLVAGNPPTLFYNPTFAKAINDVPANLPGTDVANPYAGTLYASSSTPGNGTYYPGTFVAPNIQYNPGDYFDYPSPAYLIVSSAITPQQPGNDGGTFWSLVSGFVMPTAGCAQTTIAHHSSNRMVGIACFGQYGIGVNTTDNPSYQLLYYDFTLSMLTNSHGFAISGSGTSWTMNFEIDNSSSISWDACLIELLNTGGISGASAGHTVTLAAGTHTNSGNFTLNANPASGLVTATLRITRNTVVVGTIDYPLYPIYAGSAVALNNFAVTCGGFKYWHSQLKLTKVWPPNMPEAWGDSTWVSGTVGCGGLPTHNLMTVTLSMVGGTPNLFNGSTCSVIASLSQDQSCSANPSVVINFGVLAAVGSTTAVTAQIAMGFKVAAGTVHALPTYTLPYTVPAA